MNEKKILKEILKNNFYNNYYEIMKNKNRNELIEILRNTIKVSILFENELLKNDLKKLNKNEFNNLFNKNNNYIGIFILNYLINEK